MKRLALSLMLTNAAHAAELPPLPIDCQTLLDRFTQATALINEAAQQKQAPAKLRQATEQIQTLNTATQAMIVQEWQRIQTQVCPKDAQACAIQRDDFIRQCASGISRIDQQVANMRAALAPHLAEKPHDP